MIVEVVVEESTKLIGSKQLSWSVPLSRKAEKYDQSKLCFGQDPAAKALMSHHSSALRDFSFLASQVPRREDSFLLRQTPNRMPALHLFI